MNLLSTTKFSGQNITSEYAIATFATDTDNDLWCVLYLSGLNSGAGTRELRVYLDGVPIGPLDASNSNVPLRQSDRFFPETLGATTTRIDLRLGPVSSGASIDVRCYSGNSSDTSVTGTMQIWDMKQDDAAIADAVWGAGTRTLNSYGTLVADVAAAVWTAGTRTVTSYGTLVADVAAAVWAAGTRTLSSLGTLAADMWGYATRTLTMTPTQIAAINGSTITQYTHSQWSISITGLGSIADYSKLWFTLKRDTRDDDSAALVQIALAGGLLTINGGSPASSAHGVIAIVDAATGSILITLDEAASASLDAVPRGGVYDVSILRTGGAKQVLSRGSFVLERGVTLANS